MIEKPDNERPRSAVFLYIFNKDFSKILLIKRNKEKREKWGFDWGTVGGKIEMGENSREACLREVKEEIGLEIEEDLNFAFFEEKSKEDRDLIVHFFYSVSVDENTEIKLNKEADEFRWFNVENLPESMIDTEEHIRKVLESIQTPDNA